MNFRLIYYVMLEVGIARDVAIDYPNVNRITVVYVVLSGL